MRTVFLAVALTALSSHAQSCHSLPPPGLYCPVGLDAPQILLDSGGLGIDLLDCAAVRLHRGRARSNSCLANGGSKVSLNTDFIVRRDGSLRHGGVTFRLYTDPRPCSAP